LHGTLIPARREKRGTRRRDRAQDCEARGLIGRRPQGAIS